VKVCTAILLCVGIRLRVTQREARVLGERNTVLLYCVGLRLRLRQGEARVVGESNTVLLHCDVA
jgi:hypothetical protein